MKNSCSVSGKERWGQEESCIQIYWFTQFFFEETEYMLKSQSRRDSRRGSQASSAILDSLAPGPKLLSPIGKTKGCNEPILPGIQFSFPCVPIIYGAFSKRKWSIWHFCKIYSLHFTYLPGEIIFSSKYRFPTTPAGKPSQLVYSSIQLYALMNG